MRVNGAWVGWGLGDSGPQVVTFKEKLSRKFSYARGLDRSPLYDQALHDVVYKAQGVYHSQGRLHDATGIIDYATQVAFGWITPPPKSKPVIFTVEGHMADMFAGPCAFTAQALQDQGLIRWQPVGYNNTAMPFDNRSGWLELARLVGDTNVLPLGTPWGVIGFSQGGIVHGEFFLRYIFNNGPLAWRADTLKRSLAFGNPYRENNQCASWVPDPPRPNTQGISDVRLNATQLVLPDGRPFSSIHREHARHGDLYAENGTDEAAQKKTAIYKMVQNEWTGPGSIFSEGAEILFDPTGQMLPVFKAILDGGMFLFNMGPHGMYDLGPCIEWMRGVAQ